MANAGNTKRTVGWIAGLVVAAALGFYALAWRPAIAPIDAGHPAAFPQALIARGEVLAGAGNCSSCHTVKGGAPFAGGLGIATPFGTIYSSNITPDAATGIGRWSEAAFARAMHEGVARDGSHLFPAFPFDYFTRITDDDLTALYAYLMTRAPVAMTAPRDTIPFPLNLRALQIGWKLLFFRAGVYRADPARSDAWNRGAYLAEGLAHCAACHSPRNALGATKSGAHAYAGAVIGGWFAPALTSANTAVLPWTRDELYEYLRTGGTALHGVAAGSMSEVIHGGLASLPDTDVEALAVYFAAMNRSATPPEHANSVLTAVMRASGLGTQQEIDAGAGLYLAACAACHYNSGSAPLKARPELALNSSLTAAEPTNFIQVVLHGIGAQEGVPGYLMPGFAPALSDEAIARLAAYLRRTRTEQPQWTDLEARVAAIRKQGAGQ